jgi:hypothetical protein
MQSSFFESLFKFVLSAGNEIPKPVCTKYGTKSISTHHANGPYTTNKTIRKHISHDAVFQSPPPPPIDHQRLAWYQILILRLSVIQNDHVPRGVAATRRAFTYWPYGEGEACSSLLQNVRQGMYCMRYPFRATYRLASDYSPRVRLVRFLRKDCRNRGLYFRSYVSFFGPNIQNMMRQIPTPTLWSKPKTTSAVQVYNFHNNSIQLNLCMCKT